MRWAIVLTLLTGCDQVFGLADRPPGADAASGDTVVNLCAGGSHGGNGGLLGVCLDAAPADVLSNDAAINTGMNMQDECMQIVTQADANQTEVCVIAARRIEISSAISAGGERPLVLFALDELVVTGSIDVSSRPQKAPPAGAGYKGCVLSGNNGTSRTTGGGGGAGGTFAALGGAGGQGSTGGAVAAAAGGTPSSLVDLGVVHAGCRGGLGGAGDTGNIGGPGGEGGGAIYLIAGRAITIRGTINASGGGGTPAQTSSIGGGGGGGGSGGLIGLDAPSIVLEPTAILVANGGGGAGGNGTGTGGLGSQSDVAGELPFEASGGAGGTAGGGAGGVGGSASSTAGGMGASAAAGGGGGGGAVGHVVLYAAQRDIQSGARISPAPGP